MKKFFKMIFILFLGFIFGVIFDQLFFKENYDLKKLNKEYSLSEIKRIYKIKRTEIKKLIMNEIPEIVKKLDYKNSELKKSKSENEREIRKALIKNLQSYLGKKYIYGGADPETGFDCSGLVYYSFKEIGIDIPRTVKEQYQKSRKKKISDRNIGDVLFFEVYPPDNLFNYLNDLRAGFLKIKPTHIGIYIGDNNFIHSPRQGKEISISKLNNTYWQTHLFGVGDFITDNIEVSFNFYKKTKFDKEKEREEIIEKINLEPIMIDTTKEKNVKDDYIKEYTEKTEDE